MCAEPTVQTKVTFQYRSPGILSPGGLHVPHIREPVIAHLTSVVWLQNYFNFFLNGSYDLHLLLLLCWAGQIKKVKSKR